MQDQRFQVVCWILGLLMGCYCQVSDAQVADVWIDFVDAQAESRQPILPDYSYSGYYFSERELPDVTTYTYFDVTDYGVIADDTEYDDEGIQATIDAAVASGTPAVVFFPAGRYIVSSDNDIEKSIYISGDHIVLKGEGSGEGGTEIYMDQMRVDNGHWQFSFQPASFSTGTLTSLTAEAKRGDFTVSVASTASLTEGQSVFISHRSEEYSRVHFDNLALNEGEWTRLFGDDEGLIVYECHIIERIDGNTVTFKNPIQVDMPILSEDFVIRNLRTIEGVGIEDIRFTSGWISHPENFVHHANDIVDYGWNAVQFKYVQNAWIRNCEFKDWTQVADIRESIGVTVENVAVTGKRGHASWITRRNYGVLVKDCVDTANHHHGPGVGYSGVSTVYLRYQMNPNQSIDSHSGSPYTTLYDDMRGGDFSSNGGPWIGYPHHARFLTFWNFQHTTTSSSNYDFWSVADREPATYAEPFFIGLQSSHSVNMIGEGMDENRNVMVQPRSLFEAQLHLRLTGEELVSTDDMISDNDIQVYPNPFTDVIEVNVVNKDQVQSIELYTTSASLVEGSLTEHEDGFLLEPSSELPSGVYLLEIEIDDQVISRKVVRD